MAPNFDIIATAYRKKDTFSYEDGRFDMLSPNPKTDSCFVFSSFTDLVSLKDSKDGVDHYDIIRGTDLGDIYFKVESLENINVYNFSNSFKKITIKIGEKIVQEYTPYALMAYYLLNKVDIHAVRVYNDEGETIWRALIPLYCLDVPIPIIGLAYEEISLYIEKEESSVSKITPILKAYTLGREERKQIASTQNIFTLNRYQELGKIVKEEGKESVDFKIPSGHLMKCLIVFIYYGNSYSPSLVSPEVVDPLLKMEYKIEYNDLLTVSKFPATYKVDPSITRQRSFPHGMHLLSFSLDPTKTEYTGDFRSGNDTLTLTFSKNSKQSYNIVVCSCEHSLVTRKNGMLLLPVY